MLQKGAPGSNTFLLYSRFHFKNSTAHKAKRDALSAQGVDKATITELEEFVVEALAYEPYMVPFSPNC